MQSINTNNLFMHEHEKWGGKQHCLPPHSKKWKGNCSLAPAVYGFHTALGNMAWHNKN